MPNQSSHTSAPLPALMIEFILLDTLCHNRSITVQQPVCAGCSSRHTQANEERTAQAHNSSHPSHHSISQMLLCIASSTDTALQPDESVPTCAWCTCSMHFHMWTHNRIVPPLLPCLYIPCWVTVSTIVSNRRLGTFRIVHRNILRREE